MTKVQRKMTKEERQQLVALLTEMKSRGIEVPNQKQAVDYSTKSKLWNMDENGQQSSLYIVVVEEVEKLVREARKL